MRIIAIDYDGTIVKDISFKSKKDLRIIEIPLKKGVKEFIRWLKSKRFKVILFTCRPNKQKIKLVNYLRKEGIYLNECVFGIKPRADLYIDNRGIFFKDDWNKMKRFIKKKWGIKG